MAWATSGVSDQVPLVSTGVKSSVYPAMKEPAAHAVHPRYTIKPEKPVTLQGPPQKNND